MIILPIAVLGLGAVGAWTMMNARESPKTQPVEVEPPLVEVIEAEPETLRMTVLAEGTVSPRVETQLVPEVSGRVVEVSDSLAPGGFFEKDEVLLKIDPREYALALADAKAAVAEAELQLARELQEAEVARKEWEALGEGEPNPLVVREPQVADARAALAAAEARLERAQYDLDRTVVRAPYAGRVREKSVDVGQFVSRGNAVARIFSTDVAEIRLPIPQDQLAYVDLPLAYRGDSAEIAGPRVTLSAKFAGRRYEWRGRIVRTGGEVDPESQMVYAIAQVQDPYGRKASGKPPLAVGMFVQAEIQGKGFRNVVSLPRSALRRGDRIFIVDEESRLRFLPVEILRSERDRVVLHSLPPGLRVCVSNVEAAVDGMRVRVSEAAPPEEPGEAASRG